MIENIKLNFIFPQHKNTFVNPILFIYVYFVVQTEYYYINYFELGCLLKWNKKIFCCYDDDDDDDYDEEMKWVLNYINIMKIIQGKENALEKQQQQRQSWL